ncbi:MAG: 16S rRNA (cytidine(1402)-2'-O)-methyltransferase [Ilumatobacteraceae bacterium]|nr:16S rRNA (cytidine(1402)-2'-O)-methyltransferase [Ilumatobacteraceae bacterium]
MTGTLWLVATPIGNLGDIAPRARETLEQSALVCCEDTRRTGRLLQHLGITARALAVCNDHTEHRLAERVANELAAGHDVAVVSDAGTPGISDPGERLVHAAINAGATVSAIPGACAAISALITSGLPTERFVMEGFLPRRGQERTDRLTDIAAEHRTIVLYEAPHRIVRTLADLTEICGGDRQISIGRELTKLHEETIRSTLAELRLEEPRGEYVIVIAGRPREQQTITEESIRDALEEALSRGLSRRDAAADVARRLGIPRRQAYDLVIQSPSPQEMNTP